MMDTASTALTVQKDADEASPDNETSKLVRPILTSDDEEMHSMRIQIRSDSTSATCLHRLQEKYEPYSVCAFATFLCAIAAGFVYAYVMRGEGGQ